MGRKAIPTDHTKGAALSLPVWPSPAAEQSRAERRNLELEGPLAPQHPCSHLLEGPGGPKPARHPEK